MVQAINYHTKIGKSIQRIGFAAAFAGATTMAFSDPLNAVTYNNSVRGAALIIVAQSGSTVPHYENKPADANVPALNVSPQIVSTHKVNNTGIYAPLPEAKPQGQRGTTEYFANQAKKTAVTPVVINSTENALMVKSRHRKVTDPHGGYVQRVGSVPGVPNDYAPSTTQGSLKDGKGSLKDRVTSSRQLYAGGCGILEFSVVGSYPNNRSSDSSSYSTGRVPVTGKANVDLAKLFKRKFEQTLTGYRLKPIAKVLRSSSTPLKIDNNSFLMKLRGFQDGTIQKDKYTRIRNDILTIRGLYQQTDKSMGDLVAARYRLVNCTPELRAAALSNGKKILAHASTRSWGSWQPNIPKGTSSIKGTGTAHVAVPEALTKVATNPGEFVWGFYERYLAGVAHDGVESSGASVLGKGGTFGSGQKGLDTLAASAFGKGVLRKARSSSFSFRSPAWASAIHAGGGER